MVEIFKENRELRYIGDADFEFGPEPDIHRRLGGVSSFLSFDRRIFKGNLLKALQGEYPEGNPIAGHHFYLAADALQYDRRKEFRTYLKYIAWEYDTSEYPDIPPTPEVFYECFRELAALGGEDFDAIEVEACRPMSHKEVVTALADLVEPLPDDSFIKQWVEEEQLKAFFNLEGR